MTAQELRHQIVTLQAQLSVLVAKEKTEKLAELTAKFSQVSTVFSTESDGLREWDTSYKVFHSGLDFDFSKSLSERDHDGRRSLLFELEEQGLCAVVEE